MPTDPILAYTQSHVQDILADIEQLARIESPSRDATAVNRAADWVEANTADIAAITRDPAEDFGDVLRLRFDIPGGGEDGHVLGLGHLDTVYPHGTLETMPVRRAEGRLWGPGVFDMKGGVVMFFYAVRALRQLGIATRRPFLLQLNPDEEIGSPASRPLTNDAARNATAALVAEPSFGPDGCAKTARKGGGSFTIRVQGRASHAGLDFAAGANAIVELAHLVATAAAWTDLERGITINAGVIEGGTTTNVVAEHASCTFDVRVPTAADAKEVQARFEGLASRDTRTTVSVEGGLRRPPLERSPTIEKIFHHAQGLSSELGVKLCEASVGGGSDGNYTAAAGIPTLDGIGAVGEGAHSVNESIWIDRIADRTALLAKLIATL